MGNTNWNTKERRLVIATGLSPLVVSLLTASIPVVVYGKIEALASLLAIIPIAYFTLFAFVLPSLFLLRKFQKESIWTFSSVCGLSVVLSGLTLYLTFFGRSFSRIPIGAFLDVIKILLIPSMIATIIGAVVYVTLGSKR